MKAKEYAKLYMVRPDNESEAEIARMFIVEMLDVVKKRNAVHNRAYLSVVKEFNNKWNTFMNLTGVTNTFQFVMEVFMKKFCDELKRGPGVYEELGWDRSVSLS